MNYQEFNNWQPACLSNGVADPVVVVPSETESLPFKTAAALAQEQPVEMAWYVSGFGADGTFRISQGYDGMLDAATGSNVDAEDNWTPDEQRELADFMIAQWTAFKASVKGGA